MQREPTLFPNMDGEIDEKTIAEDLRATLFHLKAEFATAQMIGDQALQIHLAFQYQHYFKWARGRGCLNLAPQYGQSVYGKPADEEYDALPVDLIPAMCLDIFVKNIKKETGRDYKYAVDRDRLNALNSARPVRTPKPFTVKVNLTH